MRLARLLSLWALLWFARAASAWHHVEVRGPARLAISSETAGATVPLSDTLSATFSVTGSAELRVERLRGLPTPSEWTLLQLADPIETKHEGNRRTWSQTMVLAPHSPGALKLRLPPLHVLDGPRARQTVDWTVLEIKVTTEVESTDISKLREYTQIEQVPSPEPAPLDRAAWIVGLVLLVVLAVLVLYRYWRGRRLPTSRSAVQAALREQRRLLASKLHEQGRGERFVTLLTMILRRYLERQFQLPARRQSTSEFLATVVRSNRFTEAQIETLRSMLEQGDLIKFAGIPAAAEQCRDLAARVRHFIEETAQRN
jgi:hypothetical protein